MGNAKPPMFDQPIMTFCPAHLDKCNRGVDQGFNLAELLDQDISTVTIYKVTTPQNHIKRL